ncbi:MAG: ribosome assembly factor SBDS [Thermoplasmata archaeon]
MVSLDKAVVARLESHGEKFEILIDPDAAQDIKANKPVDILASLAVEGVFKDSRKGERASDESLMKVFSTLDIKEIAKKIVLKGEIQLTAEQRKEMIEAKRKQIITIIARNAINPQTKTPHPPARIEAAMEEAKVHVDPFKSVEEQVKDIMNALKPIIPIRFDKVQIAVRVPGDVYGKVYGDIIGFGTIVKEAWQKNGTWIAVVEMPAGLQTDFMQKMGDKSKGQIEMKVL